MDEIDDDELESKFISEINCISHVEIKEEVIIPDNMSDGESTLSDNEKNPDIKLEDCIICCKYRSMFIILKNHDCQLGEGKCSSCAEISHWSKCFKDHRESHQLEKESDSSSDSTASDREEEEGTCKVCKKYEFMVQLLKSHVCQVGTDEKCKDCNEVLHWVSCFNDHLQSHKTKETVMKIKEENSSDSTVSDNEEIQKLLSSMKQHECEKCQICLKYQSMLIILEENHLCSMKKNEKCDKCSELIQWYKCFEKHKRTHKNFDRHSTDSVPENSFYHFGKKFDCGICLKLNAIVTKLGGNHECGNTKFCTVCQEVSYWLSCLKNHKRSETVADLSDSEDLEAVKRLGQQTNCEMCSKFRATIVNLSHHVCRRSKGREKCEICLEMSLWYRNLKVHENHHGKQVSALKNFMSCTCCGKRFSSEKMLKVHKSYCKSSYFACDICHKKFVNLFSLKKHKIFRVCRNPPISSQYICRICKMTFSNSSDLKIHKDFHRFPLYKRKDNPEFKSGLTES